MRAAKISPEFEALPAGCASSFEFAIRFHAWWQGHTVAPTWQDIAAEFDVHRATAFRWRAGYMAALGIRPTPAPRPVRVNAAKPAAEHPWRKEDREAMARREAMA